MNVLFETVDRLARTMDFHRDRHAVLAENLSNLDTPGYRPLDLKEGPSEQNSPDQNTPQSETLNLARTEEAHLSAAPLEPKDDPRLFQDTTTTPGVDGNAVNMERELAKIDANRVRYGTASEIVSRRLALLRYAAGDGQG